MAGGFPFATDIGIRMEDVEEWNLAPEDQHHRNPSQDPPRTCSDNGGTVEEAEFISEGQRVELNMLTGPQFVEFVENKLEDHGVEKVRPDEETLKEAWERAHVARQVNDLIEEIYSKNRDVPPMPDDIAKRLREALEEKPAQSWDEALWDIVGEDSDDADGDGEGAA